MKKLMFIGICVLLSFSGSLLADTLIKTIVVDGYGNSHNDALRNALIEALKQAEGVSIDSRKSYAKSIREEAMSSNEEGSSHDVAVSEQSHQKIKEITSGLIEQYNILDSRRDEDGQWIIQVEVNLSEYKTPGISPHSLRKIAVIPFRMKTNTISILKKRISANEVSRQLSQKLVTELTQSRRFTVLDREYMTEFLKERNLVLSADASTAEQMKVGEALGVDYLLLGTVTEFKASQTSQYIKTLDETVYGAKAQFNADFRIMVMATRQIKWSDTVKVVAKDKKLQTVVKNTGTQGVFDYILEKAAQKVVHSSLDNIYPIKILKVASKNSIYLNQGGKMTQVGSQYEVYTPGESVTDPDTGLAIKIDGEKVATISVTKVQAKYSLAKLLDGDVKEIQAGAILRKVNSAQKKLPLKAQRVMQPAW